MAFGKKNTVDLNPLHYNIGLIGESGIGKTTLMKEVCELLAPEIDDRIGYLHLDIGKEDGADAIEGIITEKVENWAKFELVLNDIIKNRFTEYPNLQTVILDTYDELINIAEPQVIKLHNLEHSDKPKINSINAAFGGFGKGQDKVIDLILDKLWELKKVGVHFILVMHTKTKDIDDPVTGTSYTTLTGNLSQKYFNAIKTKLHFLGAAYIDRTIVTQKTGKQNLVTKEDITRNIVTGSARVINFRDDNYSVDSKSRFSEIVDCIEFDRDAFIKAMQDAILAESAKGKTLKQAKEYQKQRDAEAIENAKKYSENKNTEENNEERSAELIGFIQTNITNVPSTTKQQMKRIMAEYGFAKFTDETVTIEALEKIVDLFKENMN